MIPAPPGFEPTERAADLAALQVTGASLIAGAIYAWWKLRQIGMTLAELRNPIALSAERRRELQLEPLIEIREIRDLSPATLDPASYRDDTGTQVEA